MGSSSFLGCFHLRGFEHLGQVAQQAFVMLLMLLCDLLAFGFQGRIGGCSRNGAVFRNQQLFHAKVVLQSGELL